MMKDPMSEADKAFERYQKMGISEPDVQIPDHDMENVSTVTTQGVSEDVSEERYIAERPVKSALSETVNSSGIGENAVPGPGSPEPEERKKGRDD
ncbi:hypothetical protein Q5741_12025 [Paenibacillus sp. JX-17]|uniref:DUF4025 domain-containing protein n=1 Tax=Paenibacillus lacisoli TaxID=3064525 RepID=A0ABT9CGT0_9BACL|nr:hypothetical protein [Paenibacillus sp. JX-17]MDO7907137.1 hypothetical protein [Paenibacillus sp. JX-17]